MTRIHILPSIAAVLLVAAPALADSITLVGGNVLTGKIVSESDAAVVLDHAALGRISVARAQIASIEITPGTAAVAVPPAAEPKVETKAETKPDTTPVAVLPAPAPPPPAKPDGKWRYSLSLGFTGSKNDTNSSKDLRAAFDARSETEQNRTTFGAEYYFKSTDGENTDNNLLVRGLEEFLFKDTNWEGFVQGTYQYDEFQDWEQRAGAYAGPGYRLFDSDTFKLRLRGGAGASYEFSSSTWTPELLFADELIWKLNDRSVLRQGLELYPDLENSGEYRFVARVDFEVALTAKNDLKATFGLRDEYDSYVESDGGTSNDVKIYGGIKLDF